MGALICAQRRRRIPSDHRPSLAVAIPLALGLLPCQPEGALMSSVEPEHTYDEEWIWNVDDQDYRILIIHHDDCMACLLGVPVEEEN